MRWWPRSLTRRILLAEIVAIAVAVVLLPGGAVFVLHEAIDIEQESLLTAQADLIARAADFRKPRITVHLSADLAQIYASGYDGRGYQIVDAKGVVRAKSLDAAAVPTWAIPRAPMNRLFHERAYVAVSKPVRANGQQFWVVTSQNERGPGAIVDDIARRFLWRYTVILAVALALLPIINAVLIRRLLRVVKGVSEQASMIGPNTPGQRLDEADLPIEITDLVRATNRLVDRLESSLRQHRHFVSNLAHEVKTPLATLKIQLDGLPESRSKREIVGTVDRLDHVVSQMRNLAELETLDEASETDFDVNQVAENIVEELAAFVYEGRHQIELRRSRGASVARGSALLIELALRNLIVNAVQHTPQGSSILVEVSDTNIITVADNGPGICSDQQGLVAQRYWRADQSRTDTAGLGISIVERICDVHGWALRLHSVPGQGASFSIDFNNASNTFRPGKQCQKLD